MIYLEMKWQNEEAYIITDLVPIHSNINILKALFWILIMSFIKSDKHIILYDNGIAYNHFIYIER